MLDSHWAIHKYRSVLPVTVDAFQAIRGDTIGFRFLLLLHQGTGFGFMVLSTEIAHCVHVALPRIVVVSEAILALYALIGGVFVVVPCHQSVADVLCLLDFLQGDFFVVVEVNDIVSIFI